ncbi:hypothetical protein VNO80_30658 [Phaseolus coccineus]|uniref:Uncharacterized protein n=1 Tax=Phaseolus coccineus TaxID=3886 RepID=A0AAN9LI81_PHACN
MEKTKSCSSILASLHKTTSIFAVQPQLPRRSRRRSPPLPGDSALGQSWCRAFRASGKAVGKVLAAEKGMDSARMIEFLGCAEFEWSFMLFMDIWKEDFGVLVDFRYRNCDFLTIGMDYGGMSEP